MKPRCGNISPERRLNNAGSLWQLARALLTRGRWFALLLAAMMFTGCAASQPKAPSVVPIWELAAAQPTPATTLGRARVPYDRPLPGNLTQRLSDDFSLVSITRPQEWQDVCRRLALTPSTTPDFSKGIVAGLLAEVGEPSQTGRWPIEIKTSRARGGLGSLEADFAPGLYYPLRTAAYLQLVYLPDVQAVGMVQIGQRTFIIRSAAPVY